MLAKVPRFNSLKSPCKIKVFSTLELAAIFTFFTMQASPNFEPPTVTVALDLYTLKLLLLGLFIVTFISPSTLFKSILVTLKLLMLLMDICLNSPTQDDKKAITQKIKILVKNFILNANINKEISQLIFN